LIPLDGDQNSHKIAPPQRTEPFHREILFL
jgi:hypothetical protein